MDRDDDETVFLRCVCVVRKTRLELVRWAAAWGKLCGKLFLATSFVHTSKKKERVRHVCCGTQATAAFVLTSSLQSYVSSTVLTPRMRAIVDNSHQSEVEIIEGCLKGNHAPLKFFSTSAVAFQC